MTCWKIIQKAETKVRAAFIHIGNIVYPPQKADMLVFKIVRVNLFSLAEEQNITKLRLQMFKKNESTPEKLPPTRIDLTAYVESTLPVDGVTKGIFRTSSTVSKNNNGVLVLMRCKQVHGWHMFMQVTDRVYRPLRCVIMWCWYRQLWYLS